MNEVLTLPDINAISTDNQKHRSCLIQDLVKLGKAMNQRPLTLQQLDGFCDASIEQLEEYVLIGEIVYKKYLNFKSSINP